MIVPMLILSGFSAYYVYLLSVSVDISGLILPNVLTPIWYSIASVKNIIKLTNSNSKITFEDLPQDDPKVRQPDITKAKEMLGWAPEINLEDGLKLTIEDFSSRV